MGQGHAEIGKEKQYVYVAYLLQSLFANHTRRIAFWCGFEVPEKPRGWILSVAQGHPIFHCPECVAEFHYISTELVSEEKQEESSPALTPVSRIRDEA